MAAGVNENDILMPARDSVVSADALDLIINRRSGPVASPAPTDAELERAFAAAAAAPDHKRLRPWRFLVVHDEDRAAFGELTVRSLLSREPSAEAVFLERERAKAQRSPIIVVAAAVITPTPDVPDIEQVIASGAATENFVLALHAQGLSASWKTGAVAYCPVFKAGLGLLPADHVIGILYVGTPTVAPPVRERPSPHEFVSRWVADR
jgi:nitroreductase